MVGVWVCKDEGGEGLAGAEGALLPSTDRTGRCPCGDDGLVRIGTGHQTISSFNRTIPAVPCIDHRWNRLFIVAKLVCHQLDESF